RWPHGSARAAAAASQRIHDLLRGSRPFPYGPRYQAQVRTFALNIIRFLEKLDVKMVVIACNTATAAALNTAREVFDIPIIGVITPGAEAAVAATKNKRVGVISTEGTMQSQEYLHAIREATPT